MPNSAAPAWLPVPRSALILDNEHPFSELSQPFAKRLLDYAKGNQERRSLTGCSSFWAW